MKVVKGLAAAKHEKAAMEAAMEAAVVKNEKLRQKHDAELKKQAEAADARYDKLRRKHEKEVKKKTEAADARYEKLRQEHEAEMKTVTEAAALGKLELQEKNDNDAKVRRGVYLRYKGKAQKLRKSQSATIGRMLDARLSTTLKASEAVKNEVRAVDKLETASMRLARVKKQKALSERSLREKQKSGWRWRMRKL